METAPMPRRMDALSVANGRRGSRRRRAIPPERGLHAAERGIPPAASAAVAAVTSPPEDAYPKTETSPQPAAQGPTSVHSSRPLHPEANRPDLPPNGPRHQGGIRPAIAHPHGGLDGSRRPHPPVAAPFQSTGQSGTPGARLHAGGVVDVHPSINVTDAGAPIHAPVASRSTQSTHRRSPKPRGTDPWMSALRRGRPIDKQTTGMPATAMVLIAAMTTSGLFDTPPVGRPAAAARTDSNPAGWLLRNGETMANTHLKTILNRVDGLHARQKVGAMAFVALQHEIHPGMNHLVAERALRGLARQRS